MLPCFDRYGECGVKICWLMSKHPPKSLQNKFKILNIDEKKYQKMEVSKFLYFEVVNFSLMLFTL